MASIDLELLRHALTVARETGLHEVEVMVHGTSFHGTLESKGTKASRSSKDRAATRSTEVEPSVQTLQVIKSTAVGIFRIEAKLAVGNEVKKGEKVGAIIALGISNDVLSSVTGKIEEVLVEENGIVEFGQILARVQEH
jgi:biotin carboxyl carrier protein